MAVNYDDVLDQLRGFGLLIDHLDTSGRMIRVRTEGGGREKRGWYTLHEFAPPGGDALIVGTYGIWQANDNGAQKVELRKRDRAFTDEQRAALKKRLREDRDRAAAEERRRHEAAARHARTMWSRLAVDGDAEYLKRKGVRGHGLRYSPKGAAVVPVLDAGGGMHGLQLLRTKQEAAEQGKPEKEFWPAGLAKKGHLHLIGSPDWLILVAEGYATGATLYEATTYPVAVVFDAGNIDAVCAALRKQYPRARLLICADDDILARHKKCGTRFILDDHPATCPECGEEHRLTNAGVAAASAAALAHKGAWLLPRFEDEAARRAKFLERGHKVNDFNDLYQAEGLHVVRTQVEARLTELQWARPQAPRVTTTTGGAGDAPLRPVESSQELLARFSLVAGQGGTVFDHQEHCLMSLSDMRDMCLRKDVHRDWQESPRRRIVRVREVGFDPAGDDPNITCNLWAGWPTTPRPGSCEKLLQLLWHMCSADRNAQELYHWVLRWVAYPIQHPGAKMKTTLVLHGPQGTGKNMFFEALMGIYGQYGRIIDQSAIEDRFNDWASRKLFLIADEVIARSDLYHVKNKLKAFITGEWIRINPKNMAAYDERNHVNIVFLSNEAMPVVLEEDDRRHAVIWTPEKLSAEFYRAVLQELAEGGVAALHAHLLSLDLGDFGPGTLPPHTEARDELISLGLDTPLRWFDELYGQEILNIKPRPGLTSDWYEVYKLWCHRAGVRAAPQPKFVNALVRKRGIAPPTNHRRRYYITQDLRGPHSFLMLGSTQVPDGISEQLWFGEQVVQVRADMNAYKGAA